MTTYMEERNIRVRRGDIFYVKEKFVLVWQDDVEDEFTLQCACLPIRLETRAGAPCIQASFEGKPAAIPRTGLNYLRRGYLTDFIGRLSDEDIQKITEEHENLEGAVTPRSELEVQFRGTRRGDVYMTSFKDGQDSEQSGARPALILSNDRGNFHAPTVVVAAMTSQDKHPLPTHVKTVFRDVENTILLEQVKTLSGKRLVAYLGRLPSEVMEEVDKALNISVGLAPFPHKPVPRMDHDKDIWFLL